MSIHLNLDKGKSQKSPRNTRFEVNWLKFGQL
jgi:hypothetical protein